MTKEVTPQYTKTGVSKNAMYWWTGQVVDESCWVENEVLPIHTVPQIPGHGKRYRVRIIGRDTQVKNVPDQQLDMADVIVPVTAGTGHGGYYETITLAQGSFVMGFFWDGCEGRQPVILGGLPNDPQTSLFNGDPPLGYGCRSGFYGLTGDKEIREGLILAGATAIGAAGNNAQEGGCCGTSIHVNRDIVQDADGAEIGVRKKNIECEGGSGPIKGIQGFIQRALAVIKKLQLFKSNASSTVKSILATISNIKDQVAGAVASLFKMIVGKMRGFVLNKINAGLKDVANMLPPSLRQAFSTGATKTLDTLACVFQKIMGTLFSMGKSLLDDIIGSYVSAPMCAAEKFVGDMLGNIIGEISDAIDSAISSISGLLDTGLDIMDGIFSVLEIVQGLLNFLKCDATPDCDYKDRWSFWNGSSLAADVSEGIAEVMENISNGIDGALGGAAGAAGGGGGAGCNTAQLPCGPPGLSFNSGGGQGLGGNLMISAGQIMGIDFTSFGGGYTSTPSISITDSCGNGGGQKIELITVDVDDPDSIPSTTLKQGDNIQVVGAVIVQPGNGFLSEPDGSTNISEPDEAIYRNPEGKWDVKGPQEIIVIPFEPEGYQNNNPTIALPVDTEVEVFDPDGNVNQIIRGEGPTNPIKIENGGTITIPSPQNSSENEMGNADFTRTAPVNPPFNSIYTNTTNGDGNWEGFIGDDVKRGDRAIYDGQIWTIIYREPRDTRPVSGGERVDVILDGINIRNPGTNYEQGDVIVVEPDTGLKLIPVFEDGTVTDVIIEDPGSTFDVYPNIYIKTTTGFNASILPIFKRRTDDPDANARKITGDRIISVDDCVGRLVIGYVNGQPYYGPFHEHRGRKMVGKLHSSKPHSYIYDTPEESLRDPYAKNVPMVGNILPTTPVDPSEYNSDGTVVVSNQSTTTNTSSTSSVSTSTPTPTPQPTPPSSGGSGGYGY